jgi:hypothetical protein
MATPDKGIPTELFEKAHCIVIVPELKTAAFIVGGKYGKGYVSCRTKAASGWSAPGAVRIEGGSVGFQIGASSTDLIMLVMSQRGAEKLLESQFTIGAGASAAAGPVGRTATAQTDAQLGADIHVQLQCNGRELPERRAMLERLPGDLVIDHVGRFMDPVPLDHPAFACLLDLLDSGRTWVKLSAPYESSRIGPPAYEDVTALAQALVRAAPERMLWASNWPHPGHTDPKVRNEPLLLDLLIEWAPEAAVRNRILVDNPAALYGF